MGNKSGSQTTVSSNDPWAPSQSYLKYGMGEADALYKAGIGFTPYQGSTVVPMANQTVEGLSSIENLSNASQSDMTKPFEQYSQNMDVFAPIARGDFSQDNAFNRALKRTQHDAQLAVDMGASSAGRYGSGVHQGNVAREIFDATDRAKLERQAFAANQMHAATTGMDTGFSMAMRPGQALLGVGSAYEDLMGRNINDQIRLHQENQQAPWNALQNYMAIQGGAGALGGVGNTYTTSQMPRDYGAAFGNALTGLSAGASMGFPLVGAALGGLSALL